MDAKQFDISVDLKKNELKNARVENLTISPSGAVSGQIHYKSDQNQNGVVGRLHVQTGSGDKTVALMEDINNAVSSYIPLSQKGQANGVATLDSSGTIPSSQLKSYVDDVLEFSSLSNFPSTGETGKIYVSTNDNRSYRWTGSQYVQIVGGGAVAGDTTPIDVSTSASVGTSGAFARADHRHKLGSRVVQGSNIATSTIKDEHIQSNSIHGNKIQSRSITNSQISGSTITAYEISNNAVSNSKLTTMSSKTVKANLGSSTGNPQDVPLSQLSQELATYGNYQPSRKVFLNPSINPSGGKCTWEIPNALNANKKRNGYHTPIIRVWKVSSSKCEEVEMAYETYSNGTLKIYFNSSSSVSSGTYQVVIDE